MVIGPYQEEFREEMLALVRTGRTPTELAKEFESFAQTIRNWVKQADLDEGNRSDGRTAGEKAEHRKLRKASALVGSGSRVS